MISFQKKASKFGKDRMMIEIPKELRHRLHPGDTFTVSKKETSLLPNDLRKLKQELKGRFVEVTCDRGIEICDGYLKDMDNQFLCISDNEGKNETFLSLLNPRIISIKPKIILKGHYINNQKVSKSKYKKALSKREFSIAYESPFCG